MTESSSGRVERWAAFTDRPEGGNPAGVVLEADGLDEPTMQRIAAEVGDPETVFVSATAGGGRSVRYFSPIAEVPFCGHATVAAALAIAEIEGVGTIAFETPVGTIEIVTETDADSRTTATFTSVPPSVEALEASTLERALGVLGLEVGNLDASFPPRIASAGNRHPILVIADRDRFDEFVIDAPAARALMDAEGWAGTMTVLHHDGRDRWTARNVFPVGEIVEDPATGSAAAAFGGYLRALDLVAPPARVVIEQGAHVGRPGRLVVDIPPAGGIAVSGTGVRIGAPASAE